MSYKPDESVLMAYMYGELEGPEKEKVEQFLLQTPEARMELEKLQELRNMLGVVKDKEVIAPPFFIDSGREERFWNSHYFKTVLAVAATLLFILVVGELTDLHIRYSGNEVRIAFGRETTPVITTPAESVTPQQVQEMINTSMSKNNESMQVSWKENQRKLDASIRNNLATNSAKIDQLARTASTASQEQLQSYVATIQTQNSQMVKDYFQLTTVEQKQYIEDLLVDFAKYLQQQRDDDMTVFQTRLNDIEQNTDLLKQETEQILSSIITNTNLNDKKY